MDKGVSIRVHGKVQGVYFRQSAAETATRLNIRGWARNEPDGTVMIEAEGEETNLQKFIEWCSSGPVRASVTNTEISVRELKNFTSFDIKY